MKQDVLLIGGGGHCRALIDVIEQEGGYSIAGIIDHQERIGQKVLGYEIVGCDSDLNKLYSQYQYAILAIGQIRSPNTRMRLFDHLKYIGFRLPFIISPRAYVSSYASIGEGTVVMHDALINAGAQIGNNCIINTKALIEHDCIIGDHCHISTGAILNGATSVGSGSFIGSHAVSKEGISIPDNSFIKAGSLVK